MSTLPTAWWYATVPDGRLTGLAPHGAAAILLPCCFVRLRDTGDTEARPCFARQVPRRESCGGEESCEAY